MPEDSGQYSGFFKSARAPRWLGYVGFGIVVFAFPLSVVNALLPEPNAFISKILMPFIFVGIASLLYHIGQHVHAIHQNALRMLVMDSEPSMDRRADFVDPGDDTG